MNIEQLLREARAFIDSVPRRSETDTQKRGETKQQHADRISSDMEHNEMQRHLIADIDSALEGLE